MDINLQSLIILCTIISFIWYLILLHLLDKRRHKKPRFFGICLENGLNNRKQEFMINIPTGYSIYINNIMPGNNYQTESLILKVKTNNIIKKIDVYKSNPNDWNSKINLKFGEEDKFIIFEYNLKTYLSGIYVPN